MRVFISWSGERSHAIAEALHAWLPKVLQTVEPFISSEDTDKGSRWIVRLSEELEQAKYGIVVVTAENREAPWLLYETGALSKRVTQDFVTPFLVDLRPGEVDPPLGLLQATEPTLEDVQRMMGTINKLNEPPLDESLLNETVERWWTDLSERIASLPATRSKTPPKRPPEVMIEEVLEVVRSLDRRFAARVVPKTLTGVNEGDTLSFYHVGQGRTVSLHVDPDMATLLRSGFTFEDVDNRGDKAGVVFKGIVTDDNSEAVGRLNEAGIVEVVDSPGSG